MSRAILVFYFLLLLATLMVTTKTVQGPWFFLFRAFFPNWKFYHSLGWQPQLYVRTRSLGLQNADHSPSTEPGVGWATYELIYPRAKRNVLNLFHNPSVNIALAHQNLVEHLANDLQSLAQGDDAKQLVSYQLVNRFVRQSVSARIVRSTAPTEYQFEIRLQLNSPTIKSRLLKDKKDKRDKRDKRDTEGANPELNQPDPGHSLEAHVLMISPVLRLQSNEGAIDPNHSPHLQDAQTNRGAQESLHQEST